MPGTLPSRYQAGFVSGLCTLSLTPELIGRQFGDKLALASVSRSMMLPLNCVVVLGQRFTRLSETVPRSSVGSVGQIVCCAVS